MKLDTPENCQKQATAIGEIIKVLQPKFEKTYDSERNSEWKKERSKITFKNCQEVIKKLIKDPEQKANIEGLEHWVEMINDWFDLDAKPSWEYLFNVLNNSYKQAVGQMTAMMFTKMSIKELMQAQGQDPDKVEKSKPNQKIVSKYLSSINPYIHEMDPEQYMDVLLDFIRLQQWDFVVGLHDEQLDLVKTFISTAWTHFEEGTEQEDMFSRVVMAYDKIIESIKNNTEYDYNNYRCWSSIQHILKESWQSFLDWKKNQNNKKKA